ncbi:MAG: FAD-binding oxidoreductase, partial [bacterium]|nr:FAD-binding oxidoreductase [bacterium]
MTQSNIYEPIKCIVEDVIEESPTIKTIVLLPSREFTFQAGQFISFTVPGVGEAPFTPSSSPFVREKIDVTVMKTGLVTSAIHCLKKGDTVGIRGPYGKPYPLESFKGKEVLLVGGGVGLAPIRALFYGLVETAKNYRKIVFCCGAKTP